MMSSTATATNFSQDAFDAFLAARDEPTWCLDRRRQAWETFQQLDWPSRNQEEWMRTDIRTFRLDRFHLPEETPDKSELPAPLLNQGVELAGSVAAKRQ